MTKFSMISKVAAATILGTVLLTGCGSSSSTIEDTTKTAYLVDAAVEGVSYATATQSGTTATDGAFKYKDGETVTFKIGSMNLGSFALAGLNSDGNVMPQDIAGVDRNDTTNTLVVKLAQLLQSLDADGIHSNGIEINSTISDAFTTDINITATTDINATINDSNTSLNITIVTAEDAQAELEATLDSLDENVELSEQLPSDGYFSKVNSRDMKNNEGVGKDKYKFKIKPEKGITKFKAGSSFIDSNNNKKFDINDTALKFDIKSTTNAIVANMLTSMLVEKEISKVDYNASADLNVSLTIGGQDLSTFDPIEAMENAAVDTNKSILNLITLNKTIAEVAQTSGKSNAMAAFKDVNITEVVTSAEDINMSATLSEVNATELGDSFTQESLSIVATSAAEKVNNVVNVIKTVNLIKAANAENNIADSNLTLDVADIVASLDDKSDTNATAEKLAAINIQVQAELAKPEVSKAVTKKAVEIAKIQQDIGGTAFVMPDIVNDTVQIVADINLTDSNLNIEDNATEIISNVELDDINTSAINDAAQTRIDDAANDLTKAQEAIEEEAAKIPVALKLIQNTITVGTKSVSLSNDLKTFTTTIITDNNTSISDYANIKLPINTSAVDKSVDTKLDLAVKITNDTTNQSVTLSISDAKLSTNKETKTMSLEFTEYMTKVKVAQVGIPSLDAIIGDASEAAIANTITTTDFDVNIDSLLGNLSAGSDSINSAINKFNDFIKVDGNYTVVLGVDANVTTDFSPITIDDNNYIGGVTGTVKVMNAEAAAIAEAAAKAAKELADTITANEAILSTAWNYLETLTITESSTLPTSYNGATITWSDGSNTITTPPVVGESAESYITATITVGEGDALVSGQVSTVVSESSGSQDDTATITLADTSVTVTAGSTTTTTFTQTPTLSYASVNSADTSVATVENVNGTITVTGVSEGNTTINVAIGDVYDTISVTVEAAASGSSFDTTVTSTNTEAAGITFGGQPNQEFNFDALSDNGGSIAGGTMLPTIDGATPIASVTFNSGYTGNEFSIVHDGNTYTGTFADAMVTVTQ